ncbi:hypothetical protein AYR66_21200 [Noviherbaspirillum denitrificans]|uniref:Uncharacterized protein n=1 Tax=Noviherbaspirillum denitrificans TaxID=1968433 RepID=A0A254TG49_9BURK|nr:hypothetical protein AYR66_21200 [Noviherbaspirillum denitrificans]
MVNWPYPGAVMMVERGDDGREERHLVDQWHWLGTAQRPESATAPSFEFDTWRILSRAVSQGKVEVRQLS